MRNPFLFQFFIKLRIIFSAGALFLILPIGHAQTDIVTYIGSNSSKVEIFDYFELNKPGHPNDKTILMAGGASDLDWLPESIVPASKRNEIGLTALNGNTLLSDSGKVGFIFHMSADMKTIFHFTHFPINSGTTVTRIRTTVRTGDPTGELFISGRRFNTDSGYKAPVNRYGVSRPSPVEEYFIARLNGNFIDSIPTAARYFINARVQYKIGTTTDLLVQSQPWDVNNKGEVVYTEGCSLTYEFKAAFYLRKADPFGNPMPVPGWMMHILPDGTVQYGNPAPANTVYSMIYSKMGYRGSLRSHNAADYAAPGHDSNGNPRPGKYPDDYFYSRYIDPVTNEGAPSDDPQPGSTDVWTGLSAGPGRTGRVADHPRTNTITSVVFDKRNNHLYIGYTSGYYIFPPPDSLLTLAASPGWALYHEFDPQIVGFDENGFIKYWDRLKKESSGDQPDHYLDNLDIDYANNMLVALARQHGDGVFTSWQGNNIAANPLAGGFKNGLNGMTGNIHISWLGKFRLSDFAIFHSTFVAEQGTGVAINQPYSEPLYDGWQNQNAGWFSTSNTRKRNDAANCLKVARDGTVALTLWTSGRPMTTSNAFQKMSKGFGTSVGTTCFIRVYSPNLKDVLYSSILNVPNPTYSGSVDILAVLPQKERVLVGGVSGIISPIKTNLPSGMNFSFAYTPDNTNYAGIMGSLAYPTLPFSEPNDTIDYPVIPVTSLAENVKKSSIRFFPNPGSEVVWIEAKECPIVSVLNFQGREIKSPEKASRIFIGDLPKGIYFLKITSGSETVVKKLMCE